MGFLNKIGSFIGKAAKKVGSFVGGAINKIGVLKSGWDTVNGFPTVVGWRNSEPVRRPPAPSLRPPGGRAQVDISERNGGFRWQ